jgi:hypothetical protein
MSNHWDTALLPWLGGRVVFALESSVCTHMGSSATRSAMIGEDFFHRSKKLLQHQNMAILLGQQGTKGQTI